MSNQPTGPGGRAPLVSNMFGTVRAHPNPPTQNPLFMGQPNNPPAPPPQPAGGLFAGFAGGSSDYQHRTFHPRNPLIPSGTVTNPSYASAHIRGPMGHAPGSVGHPYSSPHNIVGGGNAAQQSTYAGAGAGQGSMQSSNQALTTVNIENTISRAQHVLWGGSSTATQPNSRLFDQQIPSSYNYDSDSGSSPRSPANQGTPLDFSIPQPLVTITVGQGAAQDTFQVHKLVLYQTFSFFKAAFENKAFIEGQTQIMNIDDVESQALGLLVHWMYTRNLKDKFLVGSPSILLLAKVWTLAQRFLMPRLQNAVVDQMYMSRGKLTHSLEFMDCINYVYGDGGKEHPLKQLLVERLAYENVGNWRDKMDDIPHEFVLEVLNTLVTFHENLLPSDRGKVSRPATQHVEVVEEMEDT